MRTSTSLSLATGLSTSLSSRTSGEPYLRWTIALIGSSLAVRSAEVHARGDLARDDRGGDKVDGSAERRPPPCAADEVGSMLPEILEAVSGQADHEQPR